ncbi:hypothetical protein [Lentzea xinjiangensis]|nr:hypothetical protein [Lentzea xinjiangensis]
MAEWTPEAVEAEIGRCGNARCGGRRPDGPVPSRAGRVIHRTSRKPGGTGS